MQPTPSPQENVWQGLETRQKLRNCIKTSDEKQLIEFLIKFYLSIYSHVEEHAELDSVIILAWYYNMYVSKILCSYCNDEVSNYICKHLEFCILIYDYK